MFNFVEVLPFWASRLRVIDNNWKDGASVCVEFCFNRAIYSKISSNLEEGTHGFLLIFD